MKLALLCIFYKAYKKIYYLICFLNNSSDVAFLIVLGTNFHIFGAREDIVFVPKYTERLHFFLKVALFSSL